MVNSNNGHWVYALCLDSREPRLYARQLHGKVDWTTSEKRGLWDADPRVIGRTAALVTDPRERTDLTVVRKWVSSVEEVGPLTDFL